MTKERIVKELSKVREQLAGLQARERDLAEQLQMAEDAEKMKFIEKNKISLDRLILLNKVSEEEIMRLLKEKEQKEVSDNCENACCSSGISQSQLGQWPCQIKLVPVRAPYFNNANLLIAADCTAYAYANMHSDFMSGRITLIGCPKLDAVDYSEKLTEIIANNNIASVTVVRMEVPCCGGLEYAAKMALKNSGKFIPWQVVTISTDGKILE